MFTCTNYIYHLWFGCGAVMPLTTTTRKCRLSTTDVVIAVSVWL